MQWQKSNSRIKFNRSRLKAYHIFWKIIKIIYETEVGNKNITVMAGDV